MFRLFCQRRLRPSRLLYSTVAEYPECHERLVKAGFSASTASVLTTSLDRIATEKIKELSRFYLSTQEYEEILNMYHHHIERFHHDSQAIQSTHHEAERASYHTLSSNIQNASDAVMEEIKGLESGLQLDVSLEKKKIDEALKGITDTAKEADAYMKNKLQGVKEDLKSVESHARTAILGFVCILSISFIGYNLALSYYDFDIRPSPLVIRDDGLEPNPQIL
jgi:hypothetical protein